MSDALLYARIAMLERQVAALMRRLGTPFALARTTAEAVDTGAVQTVQGQLDPLSARDGIPILYSYGMTAMPPIGTDLHVAFLDSDRSRPVGVASNNQAHRLTGLATGDSALYDSRGGYVWLTASGVIIQPPSGQPVTVRGDLRVTGSVTGFYGAGGQIGLSTHHHGGVQTGSGSTGAAVP